MKPYRDINDTYIDIGFRHQFLQLFNNKRINVTTELLQKKKLLWSL